VLSKEKAPYKANEITIHLGGLDRQYPPIYFRPFSIATFQPQYLADGISGYNRRQKVIPSNPF
jgi:hypothetical protein